MSPSHFRDVREDLRARVDWLREVSGGRPIGIKLAAGDIEGDLGVAVYGKPDFVTLDGRAGATGSAPKFVKASTSIPTLFALYRARKYLDDSGVTDISLVITGGLRVSSDFALPRTVQKLKVQYTISPRKKARNQPRKQWTTSPECPLLYSGIP